MRAGEWNFTLTEGASSGKWGQGERERGVLFGT